MVIMVLAGAVAVAMEPSTRAKGQSSRNMNFKSRVTRTPATRDSNSVMITTSRPVRISTSLLKNLPTPKAMKARARSLTKAMWVMTLLGIKSIQHGPIRIPARI